MHDVRAFTSPTETCARFRDSIPALSVLCEIPCKTPNETGQCRETSVWCAQMPSQTAIASNVKSHHRTACRFIYELNTRQLYTVVCRSCTGAVSLVSNVSNGRLHSASAAVRAIHLSELVR